LVENIDEDIQALQHLQGNCDRMCILFSILPCKNGLFHRQMVKRSLRISSGELVEALRKLTRFLTAGIAGLDHVTIPGNIANVSDPTL
jgi:hypothetical protein